MKRNLISNLTIVIRRAIFTTLIAVLLTGCSGFDGATSIVGKSTEIDLNGDIETIAEGVSRFDANSALTASAFTLEDYEEISNNNITILDSIEMSVRKFKSDILEAWDELPTEDTASSPSRSKLLNWAKGYETWILYQREMQKLSSACLLTSQTKSEFDTCALLNLNRTLEFERLSRIDLSSAIQGIQEWRDSIGASNG